MAALSAAPATANTITPPSSSHGNGNQSAWNTYARGDAENLQKKSLDTTDQTNRTPLAQNGNSANILEYGFEPLPPPRKKASNDNISLTKSNRSWDRTNRRDDTSKSGLTPADDVFGTKSGVAEKRSTNELAGPTDDDKWIHRDKLAKIESQELQAAGIILPKMRSSSKPPRRGRSEEKLNGSSRRTTSAAPDDEIPLPRSRKSSVSPESRVPDDKMPEEVPSWDLRRPEEIESDEPYWVSAADKKSGSKIPVAKASPAPIPEFYLERNAPSGRRRSGGSELETIAYPKPRPRSGSANTLGASSTLQPAKRSVTDVSPRKGSGGTSATGRKPSAQVKAGGKNKTRGGKDSTGSASGNRSRPGEISPGNKRPEGDPPWMIGSYRPDPRLPPEEQLLPTVAKRLQQEQWEREGKYGSVYDREFRPLTADGLLKPPEAGSSTAPADEETQEQDEWPLKGEAPKSPTSPSIKQSNSYSTMPKISDKPTTSPLPSPRGPTSPMMSPQMPAETRTVTRVPDQSSAADMPMGGEKKKKSEGCGCCIVM
ncbi:hypothetical protein CGRA01v4_14456 [Colletotrichum graminicola]|uniref:TeaA receptor TeaR n=1 Tax=Colletotrichum graminicola (strain M1.001 / M2 / FGSC 10212) TaxID=645133 RepID=E3Q4L4_COLGM|nr:uncharacterized protein GLRG_01173 [Colletotrichum graminicola M1.001]EFQ26029.1 hypothetical protein GLRG_01173 [Colletotrichum graminicola M1.001]WDK23164.1 hypothetical protein CGRA01v4_14456 [Colletotrichum graminicola]